MSELIPQNFGQVSTRFQNLPAEDDLSSGIQSSFGIIGYKGKVWSTRYRGDEMQLMREDGDGPKSSIEVVILKSSKSISKIWYENGYVEGSSAAPDCFSNNGVTPEPTSAKKQCDSCAMCPHNQWGSRITPAGKQGKACSDSKRTAVVPVADINNDMFGGPMLLRVPAASLQDLAMYGQKMQQMGYPYYSVATRIQFDPAESFPKFKISAIRPLSDAEADLVISLRDGHQVERILSENEFATPGVAEAQTQTPEQVFEQPPQNNQNNQANTQQATTTNTTQGNNQQATQGAGGFGGATQQAERVQSQEATQQEAQQADQQAAQQTSQTDQPAQPVQEQESDEDREARELEEKLAAIKAKKAAAAKQAQEASSNTGNAQGAGGFGGAAKATNQSGTTASSQETGQTATTNASPSNEGASGADMGGADNMASDFEANLDNMLADLLPEG